MKTRATNNKIMIFAAVVANCIAIGLVIFSVVTSVLGFRDSSYLQNVENIRTLTNSVSEKVSLVVEDYTKDVSTAAAYINEGRGKTTKQEVIDYFREYYLGTEYEWQLMDNTTSGSASSELFYGTLLTDANAHTISYNVASYPKQAVVFASASEETLNQITYLNEYSDVSSLEKSFAISSVVKIYDEQKEDFTYKTLLLVVKSSKISQMMQSEVTDSYDYVRYADAVVDKSGNYVFSGSAFQGTNFLQNINKGEILQSDKDYLLECLKTEEFSIPFYFLNNQEEECIYTFSSIRGTQWNILSVVPLSSFHNVDNFSESFVHFFLAFFLLFAVDMLFVLLINMQLRRKTKEAQAANIAKSQFLSSMSHDIRTPMNAIIGMTVIANENLKEARPDTETLKDCMKTIELSGNHLLMLINDILDISKIESGKIALSYEDFSLSESFAKMIEIFQSQIKEKNLKFRTHISGVNHEFVHADELRINQVYINILSNAVKYTNQGGTITVDLTETPSPIENSARFIYRVSDNGIGMDENFRKTIFERFSRAVDSRINTIQGTGLGMAITKQLVDMMGGTIEVESQLNKGSTFTVTFDLPVANVKTESVVIEGHSVLLIDDDAILLETAKTMLEKAGITVDMADGGVAGIRMAEEKFKSEKMYDIVFVDWKMSDINGENVLKTLRKECGNGIKLIVMTAYNVADVERVATAAGANAFITKPLFASKLTRVIQKTLGEVKEEKKAEEAKSFSLKVLVAEDNNLNWKVLDKILQRYSIHADRAENGELAVEAVNDQTKDYDLVLMDIQMPVMNGYVAAEKIRSLADEHKRYVPIYAMTADAFAEDIAACLQAGMNGHLAKPIEMDKLLKVLSVTEKQKGLQR